MSDLGRSGDYIEKLGAKIHDAITFVADNEDTILALQGLTLTIFKRPIVDFSEIYTELDRFDRSKQRYVEIAKIAAENWGEEVSQILNIVPLQSRVLPSIAPITVLALSLAFGIELWRQEKQRSQSGLFLAFTIATPESMESELTRLTFTERQAALVIRPGSVDVLLLLKKLLKARSWAVSLVSKIPSRIRSAEGASQDLVKNLRKEREKNPNVIKLTKLQELNLDPDKQQHVIIFLHGLLSTDLGTFDGFIKRWQAPEPSKLSNSKTVRGA